MSFGKLFLPYCIERVEGDLWVVVNRAYKPLGHTGTEWVDYRPHAVRMQLTEKRMIEIDCRGRAGPDTVWLYDDGCAPTDSAEHWQTYQRRLERLSQIKVSPG